MQITYVTDKKGSDLLHHAKYILFKKIQKNKYEG